MGYKMVTIVEGEEDINNDRKGYEELDAATIIYNGIKNLLQLLLE